MEQLAGKEVSAKSDIYALGLVLYEIFTGSRAFGAGTTRDLLPRAPSLLVTDIDTARQKASSTGMALTVQISLGKGCHWVTLSPVTPSKL
jgi:serine/threonine protein kinase